MLQGSLKVLKISKMQQEQCQRCFLTLTKFQKKKGSTMFHNVQEGCTQFWQTSQGSAERAPERSANTMSPTRPSKVRNSPPQLQKVFQGSEVCVKVYTSHQKRFSKFFQTKSTKNVLEGPKMKRSQKFKKVR